MRAPSARLVLFFWKTYFFRPANNPIPAAVAVLLAFFHLEGGLDKSHIALALYIVVAGHVFTGHVFHGRERAGCAGDESPLLRFFQALPLPGRKVFLSYLAASTAYMVLVAAVLGFLLVRFMSLPDWTNLEIVTRAGPGGDSVTVVQGFSVSARGIHSPASMVLEKSILFDTLREVGGAGRWITAYMAAAFLYVSVLPIYQAFRAPRRRDLPAFLLRLPFAAYGCLGAVLLAEVVLTQRTMGISFRFLAVHAEEAALLFLILLAATILSFAAMSRAVWKELGRSAT